MGASEGPGVGEAERVLGTDVICVYEAVEFAPDVSLGT